MVYTKAMPPVFHWIGEYIGLGWYWLPFKVGALAKGKLSKYVSSRNLDLLILISGFVLGASIEFLSTHIQQVGNYFIAMFLNLAHHDLHLVQQNIRDLCAYVRDVSLGIELELAAIVIIIIILVLFYRRGNSNHKDETSEKEYGDKQKTIGDINKEIREHLKGLSNRGQE
jgi:hypothetical protein